VACDAEQVHSQVVDADRDLADGLRGVGVHDPSGGVHAVGDLRDGLDGAGLVLGEDQGAEPDGSVRYVLS